MKRAEMFGTWIFGAASAAAGAMAFIRWRDYRMALEALQTPAHIEPGIYELCERCWGEGEGCIHCFDLGVVLHDCE